MFVFRVPFGKAHDHARDIVENHEALNILTNSLTKFSQVQQVRYLAYCPKLTLSVKFGHKYVKINIFETRSVTSANVIQIKSNTW